MNVTEYFGISGCLVRFITDDNEFSLVRIKEFQFNNPSTPEQKQETRSTL